MHDPTDHRDDDDANRASGRDDGDGLDRRGFLRLTGQAALVAALARLDGGGVVFAQEAGPERVAMQFFPNFAPSAPSKAVIRRKLELALQAIDGLAWLKPGDSVAINVASNSAKPYPMTTHPVALQAFVELLKAKGAGQVIVADLAGMENVAPPMVNARVTKKIRELWGDLQTGVSTGLETLEKNGIAGAARAGGASVRSFDAAGDWVHVSQAGLGWTKDKAPSWPARPWWKELLIKEFRLAEGGFRVPKLVKQVDHLVNFARPSGHVMAGHTGTIKNWYGWLHPNDRVWSHTRIGLRPVKRMRPFSLEFKEVKLLQERIAEVALAFKPKTRLNLAAGIDTYCDVGPDWGVQPLQQSWVMASTEHVAIDAALAAVVAHEKRRVPAEERAKNYQHAAPGKVLPLIDDEVFWGKAEGGMHRFHRTYVIDAMIKDPQREGILAEPQIHHAAEIGLGSTRGEYVVDGKPDAAYLGGVSKLTGGKLKPGSSAGATGRLRSGGK